MKGSVYGESYVGGLVGDLEYSGSITDSYALADVEATDSVCGGLVGYGTQVSIDTSYAAGLVTTPSFAGGLVANGDNLFVEDCYYDEQVAGVSGNGWGTPKNTFEMKDRTTFEGWDFDTVWAIDSGVNEGYPYLQWEEKFWKAKGDGGSSGCSTGLPLPLFLVLLAPLALLGRKAGV